jgi:hypothetical protein
VRCNDLTQLFKHFGDTELQQNYYTWVLMTNYGTLEATIDTLKCRTGCHYLVILVLKLERHLEQSSPLMSNDCLERIYLKRKRLIKKYIIKCFDVNIFDKIYIFIIRKREYL